MHLASKFAKMETTTEAILKVKNAVSKRSIFSHIKHNVNGLPVQAKLFLEGGWRRIINTKFLIDVFVLCSPPATAVARKFFDSSRIGAIQTSSENSSMPRGLMGYLTSWTRRIHHTNTLIFWTLTFFGQLPWCESRVQKRRHIYGSTHCDGQSTKYRIEWYRSSFIILLLLISTWMESISHLLLPLLNHRLLVVRLSRAKAVLQVGFG